MPSMLISPVRFSLMFLVAATFVYAAAFVKVGCWRSFAALGANGRFPSTQAILVNPISSAQAAGIFSRRRHESRKHIPFFLSDRDIQRVATTVAWQIWGSIRRNTLSKHTRKRNQIASTALAMGFGAKQAAKHLGVPAAPLERAAHIHGYIVQIGSAKRLKPEELGELIDKCRVHQREPGSTHVKEQDAIRSGSSGMKAASNSRPARQTASKLKALSRGTSQPEACRVMSFPQTR